MGRSSDFSQFDAQRAPSPGQTSQGSRRRGPLGCLVRNVAGLLGLLILGVAFLVGFDYLVAPWAWGGYFGQPTLIGEWVGTFTLPAGQRGAAYLDMAHNPNRDFEGSRIGPPRAPLNGTAQSCFSASDIQIYTLSGGANASADNILLGFGANKPTVPGYALQDLKGAWDGDTLTLSGTFTVILDAQDSTRVSSEPNETQPTTIVFHKGSQRDFESACQTLGQ